MEIDFRLGDSSLLTPQSSFDLVIANINRNILLADMDKYAAVLNPGGTLLLSGFYEADEPVLVAKAATFGLTLAGSKCREGWSSLKLVK